MQSRTVYTCEKCGDSFSSKHGCRVHEIQCMDKGKEAEKLIKLFKSYGAGMDDTPEGAFDNFDQSVVDFLLNKKNQERFLMIWDRHDTEEGEYAFFMSEAQAASYLETQLEEVILEDNGYTDLEDCVLYDRNFPDCNFRFKHKVKVSVSCHPSGGKGQ